jgi:hypothetical protein
MSPFAGGVVKDLKLGRLAGKGFHESKPWSSH